jgi:hypothetical protein
MFPKLYLLGIGKTLLLTKTQFGYVVNFIGAHDPLSGVYMHIVRLTTISTKHMEFYRISKTSFIPPFLAETLVGREESVNIIS